MASSLDQLMKQLSARQTTYTPLTEAQMQRQAQTRYQSLYDQKRLDAQQSYQTQDAALARQLADEQAEYETQRSASESSYRQQAAAADRQSLSRGMQRSSYTGATVANIRLAGEAARQQLSDQQARRQQAIGDQRTALSRQLSSQLSQLNESQRADELAYMDQLADREYTRLTDSRKSQTDLSLKLYEYQHQLEQEAAQASRWRQEFNARYVNR